MGAGDEEYETIEAQGTALDMKEVERECLTPRIDMRYGVVEGASPSSARPKRFRSSAVIGRNMVGGGYKGAFDGIHTSLFGV